MNNNRQSTIVGFTVILSIILTAGVASAWNFTVPAQPVQPQNGAFTFPVSAFQDGKAKHFEFKTPDGQRVRFFIVKSKDGALRAALDACEVCFKGKKGYVQQGNDMVCVNCGMKFKTEKVGEIKGGCNPSPLKLTVKGADVVVSQQDLMNGLHYFQ
jgi:uncharacterized membrane protein